MIRIASGRFCGRALHVIDRTEKSLRPTSMKCRAAIFNILTHTFHVDWSTSHVLDLFAGTGALGFEALSRGSPSVTFLEGHRLTAQAIAKTCKMLEVTECTQVINWTIANDSHSRKAYLPKALSTRGNPFSVIFCDPPYATPLLALNAIALLKNADLIAPQALLVLELHDAFPDTLCPPGFTFRLSRVYGDTQILFVQANT